MATFAAIHLDPGSLLAWVAVGLIPGFLAARVWRGGGYGPVRDSAVGLAGVIAAVAAGALTRSLAPDLEGSGVMPGLLAAALAASVLVAALRSPAPARTAF
jgi:uncharacterized membrane protein YeaQ/YmgE (transglycosylase-associated protein family)